MKRFVLLAALCITGCSGDGLFEERRCPQASPLEDGTYISSAGRIEVLGDTVTMTSNDGVVHEYRIDGLARAYTYISPCGPRPLGQNFRTFTTETDGAAHRLRMSAAQDVTIVNPVVRVTGTPATRTTPSDEEIVVEFDGAHVYATVYVTWTLRRNGEDDITESVAIFVVDDENALTITNATCL